MKFSNSELQHLQRRERCCEIVVVSIRCYSHAKRKKATAQPKVLASEMALRSVAVHSQSADKCTAQKLHGAPIMIDLSSNGTRQQCSET
jgi:hypothetical protein